LDPAERFQTPGEVARALRPFCTKANAVLKAVKADGSRPADGNPGRSAADAVAAVTQIEGVAGRRMGGFPKAALSSVDESPWDGMVDFEQTEREMKAATNITPKRRRPWVWSSVAVGVLIPSVLAVWMGGLLRVKTPDGILVLENVPQDSEILVDGNKITFSRPGLGKAVEIQAVPGEHKLEVRKDGFKTFGQVVVFKSDGPEEVRVRLEPFDGDRTGRKRPADEQPAPTGSSNRIPPSGPARLAARVIGGLWTVEGDEHVKEGPGFGRVIFGDERWTDYDLTFEARKSAGPEGFGGIFRESNGKHYFYHFGYVNNSRHFLCRYLAEGHKFSDIQPRPGAIQAMEWYRVKVSQRGAHIRIELDDHLLFACDDYFSRGGNIGLGFYDSSGRYRNIKVTAPDGTVLWEGPPDLPEK
jgi:hypothetical protein